MKKCRLFRHRWTNWYIIHPLWSDRHCTRCGITQTQAHTADTISGSRLPAGPIYDVKK